MKRRPAKTPEEKLRKALRRGVVQIVGRAMYEDWQTRPGTPAGTPDWTWFEDLAEGGRVALRLRIVRSRAGQWFLAMAFNSPSRAAQLQAGHCTGRTYTAHQEQSPQKATSAVASRVEAPMRV
jgi:hypothetical protein